MDGNNYRPKSAIKVSPDDYKPKSAIPVTSSQENFIPQSPLSLLQRGKLSFATPQGRRQYLTRMFPQGIVEIPNKRTFTGQPAYAVRTTRGLQEIDPNTFEGLGDVADVVDELIRAGGMTYGGAKGAGAGFLTGGPVGSIIGAPIGAGLGRAGGQATVQAIGQLLGVRPGEQLPEQFKEVGGEAVSGALGEMGGRIVPAAGKLLWKKALRPGIENFANLFANIPKEETKYVLEKGPSKVLTRQARAEEVPYNIMGKVAQGIDFLKKQTSTLWKKTVEPVRSDATQAIDFNLIQEKTRGILRKFRYLDNRNRLRPMVGLSPSAKPVLDFYAKKIVPFTKGRMTINDALTLREDLDSLIGWGKRTGLFGDKEKTTLRAIRGEIKNAIHSQSQEVTFADNAWEKLRDATKIFEKIDPRHPETFKTGEEMIKKFNNLPKATKVALQRLEDALPEQFRFINDTLKFSASKAFEGIRPRFLTATGLGLGGGYLKGPGFGAATGAAGLLLTSPRALGGILKLGEKTAQTILPTISPTVKYGLPILRRR